MQRLRVLAAALCVGILGAVPDARAAGEAPAGKVVLGRISISFYAVAAGVVQEVLERLGHQVEIRQGSHAQIFPLLGSGEVDVLVAAWLPHGHAVYWQQYRDRAEPLAVLYKGARFYWMVPDYVPAALVESVDDLRKPAVLQRMDRNIPGTGPDSGLMISSARMMQEYGLEAAGYRLLPGPHTAWLANYRAATAEGRWFVMPLWRPQFINRIGNMRPLVEPRNLLGDASDGTLVASKDWLARAPQRTLQVLGRMHLGLDAVADMDYLVNVDGIDAREAARQWMRENSSTVESWFAGS